MFNKEEIVRELMYIDNNFDFYDDTSTDVKNYILKNGLAAYYDDILMLTLTGEITLGKNKEELGFTEEDLIE